MEPNDLCFRINSFPLSVSQYNTWKTAYFVTSRRDLQKCSIIKFSVSSSMKYMTICTRQDRRIYVTSHSRSAFTANELGTLSIFRVCCTLRSQQRNAGLQAGASPLIRTGSKAHLPSVNSFFLVFSNIQM